jgi:hypothetical protein
LQEYFIKALDSKPEKALTTLGKDSDFFLHQAAMKAKFELPSVRKHNK